MFDNKGKTKSVNYEIHVEDEAAGDCVAAFG